MVLYRYRSANLHIIYIYMQVFMQLFVENLTTYSLMED